MRSLEDVMQQIQTREDESDVVMKAARENMTF